MPGDAARGGTDRDRRPRRLDQVAHHRPEEEVAHEGQRIAPELGIGEKLARRAWPLGQGDKRLALGQRQAVRRPRQFLQMPLQGGLEEGQFPQVGLQQGLERLGGHGAQGSPGASAERELPAADALALGPQRGKLRRCELPQSGEALDAAEAVDADQLDLGQGLAQREARQHAHESRLVVEIVLQPQHDVTIVGGRPRQPPVGLAQFGPHPLARQAGAFGDQRRTAGQPGVEGGRRAEPGGIGE